MKGLLWGLLAWSWLGLAQAAEPVLKVFAEDYPPFNYQGPEGPAGPNTRRVQALLARAGVAASIEFQPWARAYQQARTNAQSLIFSMHRTQEREQEWLWLAELSAEANSLYRLDKHEALQGVAREALPGYRIGVIRNSSSQELLAKLGLPPGQLDAATDMEQNLRKLIAGRVDFIAAQDSAIRDSARKLKLRPERFVPALRLNEAASLYLAANPKLDSGLRRRLEQALTAMQADGSWQTAGQP